MYRRIQTPIPSRKYLHQNTRKLFKPNEFANQFLPKQIPKPSSTKATLNIFINRPRRGYFVIISWKPLAKQPIFNPKTLLNGLLGNSFFINPPNSQNPNLVGEFCALEFTFECLKIHRVRLYKTDS